MDKAQRQSGSASEEMAILPERLCGALVWVAGEDFEASPEAFAKFYAKSGLQRKKVTMGAVRGRK